MKNLDGWASGFVKKCEELNIDPEKLVKTAQAGSLAALQHLKQLTPVKATSPLYKAHALHAAEVPFAARNPLDASLGMLLSDPGGTVYSATELAEMGLSGAEGTHKLHSAVKGGTPFLKAVGQRLVAPLESGAAMSTASKAQPFFGTGLQRIAGPAWAISMLHDQAKFLGKDPSKAGWNEGWDFTKMPQNAMANQQKVLNDVTQWHDANGNPIGEAPLHWQLAKGAWKGFTNPMQSISTNLMTQGQLHAQSAKNLTDAASYGMQTGQGALGGISNMANRAVGQWTGGAIGGDSPITDQQVQHAMKARGMTPGMSPRQVREQAAKQKAMVKTQAAANVFNMIKRGNIKYDGDHYTMEKEAAIPLALLIPLLIAGTGIGVGGAMQYFGDKPEKNAQVPQQPQVPMQTRQAKPMEFAQPSGWLGNIGSYLRNMKNNYFNNPVSSLLMQLNPVTALPNLVSGGGMSNWLGNKFDTAGEGIKGMYNQFQSGWDPEGYRQSQLQVPQQPETAKDIVSQEQMTNQPGADDYNYDYNSNEGVGYSDWYSQPPPGWGQQAPSQAPNPQAQNTPAAPQAQAPSQAPSKPAVPAQTQKAQPAKGNAANNAIQKEVARMKTTPNAKRPNDPWVEVAPGVRVPRSKAPSHLVASRADTAERKRQQNATDIFNATEFSPQQLPTPGGNTYVMSDRVAGRPEGTGAGIPAGGPKVQGAHTGVARNKNTSFNKARRTASNDVRNRSNAVSNRFNQMYASR